MNCSNHTALYFRLILTLICFVSLGSSTQAQENKYDIKLELAWVGCESKEMCYYIQLRSAGAESWRLSNSNYRMFWDSRLINYSSSRHFLNSAYSDVLIDQVEEYFEASGFGVFSFEETIGFLDFGMLLVDPSLYHPLILGQEYITIAEVCFIGTENLILPDPNSCLELFWSHTDVPNIEPLTLQYVTINEIVGNQHYAVKGNQHVDIDIQSEDQACHNTFCGDGVSVFIPSGDREHIIVEENTERNAPRICLNKIQEQDILIGYELLQGSATNGVDFAIQTQENPINIAAGSQCSVMKFNIIEDSVIEPDESFTIRLSDAPENVAISTLRESRVIIQDDDQPAPTISCPSDLVLSHGDNQAEILDWLASADARDSQNRSLSITNNFPGLDQIPVTCQSSSSLSWLAVIFTATDNSGNDSSCTARVRIIDDVSPFITCPPDLVLASVSDLNAPISQWLFWAAATDNCDDDVVIVNNFPGISRLEVGSPLTVTFTAEDDCGNTSTCTRLITLPPLTMNCPQNLILECNTDYASNINTWLQSVSASSTCTGQVSITNDYTVGNLPTRICTPTNQNRGLNVTFTATDDCNNTAICSAKIFIVDSEPPTIICTSDITLECDGDYYTELEDWFALAITSDNCDQNLAYSHNFDGNLPSIECAGSSNDGLIITYTATDDCGNRSTCTARIHLQDNTPPTISCPQPITVSCSERTQDIINQWLQTSSAFDHCDDAVEIFITIPADAIEEACNTGGSVIQVVFTASDNCGNESTCQSQITIDPDYTGLGLVCPQDLTLECDNNVEADIELWLNSVEGYDVCAGSVRYFNDFGVVDLSELVQCSDEQPIQTEVTFLAIDDCGSREECTSKITIVDTKPPVLPRPTDLTLNCGDPNFESNYQNYIQSIPFSFDACEGALPVGTTLPHVDIDSLRRKCSEGGGVVVYNFFSNDSCGNDTIVPSNITLLTSNESLVIDCTSDLVVECDRQDISNIINAWLTNTTASSSCTGLVLITNDYVNGTMPGTECNAPTANGLVVTFTARDNCGNSNTCTAKIIILDTTDPVISCFVDLILDCDDDASKEIPLWLAQANAQDNCDESVVITNNYVTGNLPAIECYPPNNGGLIVTFTATDDCGSTATCSARVRIIDRTAPAISCPDNLTLSCDGDYETEINSWLALADANDVCDGEIGVTNNFSGVESLGFVCADTGSNGLVVTFTATDGCNNSSTCTARIILVDDAPPVLTCPQDFTVSCSDPDRLFRIINWTNSVSAFDNCLHSIPANNNLNFNEVENVCSNNSSQTTILTFIATDDCGNKSSCQANLVLIGDEEVHPVDMNLSVLLEGALFNAATSGYNTLMSTRLNNLGLLPGQIPTGLFSKPTQVGHPYSYHPWNYQGMEQAMTDTDIHYDEKIVDWVLVSLRSDKERSTEVCRRAALLMNDGQVLFTDEEEPCMLPDAEYYVVIEHRNHLNVMSATPMDIVNGNISYDFSLQNSYKGILSDGQILCPDGRFAMYAANADHSANYLSYRNIDADDDRYYLNNFGRGDTYILSDYNCDSDTNGNDRILIRNNFGKSSEVD